PDPAMPGAQTAFAALPGIVSVLKDPTSLNIRGNAINKPLSLRIADAIELAGLQPTNRGRKAGDWELGELLDEGPGWQDFLGTRPKFDTQRRVRIYLAGSATTAEDEARLRREADREFKLLSELSHESIADAKDLVQAERGPAVLFNRAPDEERLDLWASEHLKDLSLDTRIELVRQLGEALAHAHARKIAHRALSARCVLVRPSPLPGVEPLLVIGHWQAGARELATRLTRHSTSPTMLGGELAERLAADEQVYLAPESFTIDGPDPVALDVFSLGTLAYLLLTGSSPGDDLAARDAMLSVHHGLSLASKVDGLPSELETLVQIATDPRPTNRGTVKELLELLDEALDTLTAPTTQAAEGDSDTLADTVDPLAAHQGAMLEGGWQVLRRLGSGSTAVALLCQRAGSTELEVLKVAKDEELAERLRDEARALERLNDPGHPGIVRLYGIERVGGRTTLRLAPAGDPEDKAGLTLADRLNVQGRVGLDLLERFGTDLLDIVEYLESMGVAHRDIKPDNLGVRPRPGDRSLHLILFDLSLTKTPDTSLGAGTPGYLDPFLPERPGKRWDPAADRYAAAATLHEMATGTRPTWGDGKTDPLHLTDEVPKLDAELFDPSVREPIVRFFERALHRRPAKRFDTPDEMRQAWRAVFARAARGGTSVDDAYADAAVLEAAAANATPATSIAELGLSGVATSVLERRGIGTVEQLMAMSTMDWNRAIGVGVRVRREVLEMITMLRDHIDIEPDIDDALVSIDHIVTLLIPRPTTAQALADGGPLGFLLGLEHQAELGAESPTVAWPSTADARSSLDMGRTEYDALLDRARGRWAKNKVITQVRNDVAALLERSGGVLPGDEIADVLLIKRGCNAAPEMRLPKARAVVRAALETEAARATNRFTWRRLGGGAAVVVALRSEDLEAEELADYAANLGIVADQLAASDPLPLPNVALDRLRTVPTPAGLTPLPDARLARLAAAASATTAVSSRLELYPRGLPPDRSVRLARAALLGAGVLSEEDVRTRVRTRFPAAAPLPQRPQLDRLLDAALGLEWSPGGPGATGVVQAPGFRVPSVSAVAPSTMFGNSGTRYRTGTSSGAPDEQRAIADSAHDRLSRHARNGGYLVMTANPRRQHRAIEQLSGYGPTVLDVDHHLIGAIRAQAEAKNVRWETVIAADAAGADGPRWANLMRLVRDAIANLRTEWIEGGEHVLLTVPGLLGRYDQTALLDELRELTRDPRPGQQLRTLWVLVAADDPAASPTIFGRAVPITTLAEHMVLPDPWLENLHHTRPTLVGDPS
ncbi:MAG: pglW, partial [Aeromicrobium sp.]|nr:pglW [Aeromicrobium sp.]